MNCFTVEQLKPAKTASNINAPTITNGMALAGSEVTLSDLWLSFIDIDNWHTTAASAVAAHAVTASGGGG
jgi:hypothetical protein